MTQAAAYLAIVAFLVLAHLLRIPVRAAGVARSSRQAVSYFRNPGLTDLEKERAMQALSKRLFLLFIVLTASAALALALPLAVIALLDKFEVLDLDAVIRASLSWEVLLAGTLTGSLALVLNRKRRA